MAPVLAADLAALGKLAPGLRIGGAAIVEATHLFQIHVHMAMLRSVIGDHWYVAG